MILCLHTKFEWNIKFLLIMWMSKPAQILILPRLLTVVWIICMHPPQDSWLTGIYWTVTSSIYFWWQWKPENIFPSGYDANPSQGFLYTSLILWTVYSSTTRVKHLVQLNISQCLFAPKHLHDQSVTNSKINHGH